MHGSRITRISHLEIMSEKLCVTLLHNHPISDSIEGIEEARSRVVDLLKSKWSTWKWIDHIPKAVTAFSLAEGPHFGDLEDYLMLKQRDIQILLSLVRDVHLNDQLSTFINSLLSTCHDPRDFYGYNLVKLLKEQVMSENFTHPTSYLALCNANETWPDRVYQDLANTYNSSIDIPFRREHQAFAVMALSCEIRRRGNHSVAEFKKFLDFYETNIREFKALQKPSGSFGNVHRTALITQALIASGHEQETDWNYSKAMETLMQSINTSTTDIISIYLILPLLNGKSLTNIAFTNCSSLRNHDDLVAEIHDDYLGPKIKIQYSLFVGDPKDAIYTIVLKVPKHYGAFDVMQLISRKYPKYE
ncbi:uncharacterized protein CG3556-like [Parasteatoda tepidariorum]|uniref:uncharacterized protein CG3556-like n=1 Tax=Parasteatoda tepidariorum TaxID=114398 RepID=UPI0039BC396A